MIFLKMMVYIKDKRCDMNIKCFKCGSENIIKNGKVFGWQRYKCKDCNYQFTKMAPGGKPIYLKLLAHNLYTAGLSMRETARILGVTVQSVSRWIRKWHLTYINEQGDKEVLYKVNSDNILDCMNFSDVDENILITNKLDSGAKINILIQLPK